MKPNYKGYLIVGHFNQTDVWSMNNDNTDGYGELVEEWDRDDSPSTIQIWSTAEDKPHNQIWSLDETLDVRKYQSVKEAKQAIDEHLEANDGN